MSDTLDFEDRGSILKRVHEAVKRFGLRVERACQRCGCAACEARRAGQAATAQAQVEHRAGPTLRGTTAEEAEALTRAMDDAATRAEGKPGHLCALCGEAGLVEMRRWPGPNGGTIEGWACNDCRARYLGERPDPGPVPGEASDDAQD